ncbi:unnamed protein product [Amaranthus hypochondriacus]
MASFIGNIPALVKKIKENLVVKVIENPSSFISHSAYDTAWLAMIGDPKKNDKKPMFKSCLDWVLNNQKNEGFWGELDSNGNPTIDSIPSTLACMVVLKMWGLGHKHIEKGMAFLDGNLRKLVKQKDKNEEYPRWFAIVFPGMLEIAQTNGLELKFSDDVEVDVTRAFRQRQHILNTEKLVDKYQSHTLLSCLEVLPEFYEIDHQIIISHLSSDGSLFHSPAASAAAYIATKNPETLSYLRTLVQNCSDGVPPMYPIDEDFVKLCMVNQLQRLGLSSLFEDEIQHISQNIYGQYNEQKASQDQDFIQDMFKTSLAFQVLRIQGFDVSPRRLSRFLNDEYCVQHIENNHEMFGSVLYNFYRASNLMFESEMELKDLRNFSKTLLSKSCLGGNPIHDGIMMWPNLQQGIKRELVVPWMARMDHLDQREWIEANNESLLWLGKASFYRISCLNDKNLLQLAKARYEYRQMIYKKELMELIRWSKEWGLANMGFAREKTTYCYFAVIASAPFIPDDSLIRKFVTKSAVIITVFDDFFDMEGSLDQLQKLTNAVQRWDNNGLSSHSKILFDLLNDFVDEVAKKYFEQHQIDITSILRENWYEIVDSWLTEATWSKTGEIPSMESYLETGKISIAAHILPLHSSCFMNNPSLNSHQKFNPCQYEEITQLLMTTCRLLNDIQSYEKEVKDGKINSVLLHLKENPNAKMEDAVEYIQNIIEASKMKLLEHALIDGDDDNLPRSCKMLHLSTLKAFQMFFNSTNYFDTKDTLLNDINRAIFVPFQHDSTPINLPSKPLSLPSPQTKKALVINSWYKLHMTNYDKSPKFTMHGIPNLATHQLNNKALPSYGFRFAF